MAKLPRARPRHREHQVQWDTESLRAMDMRKTRWIRNDRICNKRLSCELIRLNARAPALVQHFVNHFAFPLYFASA
jgi:hypothetical protein